MFVERRIGSGDQGHRARRAKGADHCLGGAEGLGDADNGQRGLRAQTIALARCRGLLGDQGQCVGALGHGSVGLDMVEQIVEIPAVAVGAGPGGVGQSAGAPGVRFGLLFAVGLGGRREGGLRVFFPGRLVSRVGGDGPAGGLGQEAVPKPSGENGPIRGIGDRGGGGRGGEGGRGLGHGTTPEKRVEVGPPPRGWPRKDLRVGQ